MTVRVVIALELPDNHPLLTPMVDGQDVIDAMSPEQVAAEWLADASGFHTGGHYQVVAVERIAS